MTHRDYGIELGKALDAYYKAEAALEALPDGGVAPVIDTMHAQLEEDFRAAAIGRLVAKHLKELAGTNDDRRCCE